MRIAASDPVLQLYQFCFTVCYDTVFVLTCRLWCAVNKHKLNSCLLTKSGPSSVVGIATGYGLDGPGIESHWRRDFLHLYTPALGRTQPPVQWLPGLSRGERMAGA